MSEEKQELPWAEKYRLIKLGLLPKTGPKPKKPLRQVSPKRAAEIAEQKKAGTDELLDKWFEDKMTNSLRKCENCGKSLAHYNDLDWRGSQHHVLEKALYPSVATHPMNHLVLGKWCCHHVWHVSWEKASKMSIFPKAIDIIKNLYTLLPTEEKKKLPEVVIQEIPPSIYNK